MRENDRKTKKNDKKEQKNNQDMLLIWIYIAGSVLAVIATASAILYFDRKHDEISMRLRHSFIHVAATYAAAALLSWMWMLVLAVSIVTVRMLTLDFFEEDGCDE